MVVVVVVVVVVDPKCPCRKMPLVVVVASLIEVLKVRFTVLLSVKEELMFWESRVAPFI